MFRVALEGRSLPVVHGCGWDSGAARERSSAHWLPASPRVTRSVVSAFRRASWSLRKAGGRPAPSAPSPRSRMVKAARRVSTFWEPGPVRWARLRPSR